MKDSTLTQDRLHELLSYNPDNGEFHWLVTTSSMACSGYLAGCKTNKGYVSITIDRCSYLAHRLAWLYMHGSWPQSYLDHINGIKDDNRIANLREASHAENHQNQKLRRTNKSGHPGVCWHSRDKVWQSFIGLKGKRLYIGSFDDIEDAIEARVKAKAALHKFQPFERFNNIGVN